MKSFFQLSYLVRVLSFKPGAAVLRRLVGTDVAVAQAVNVAVAHLKKNKESDFFFLANFSFGIVFAPFSGRGTAS